MHYHNSLMMLLLLVLATVLTAKDLDHQGPHRPAELISTPDTAVSFNTTNSSTFSKKKLQAIRAFFKNTSHICCPLPCWAKWTTFGLLNSGAYFVGVLRELKQNRTGRKLLTTGSDSAILMATSTRTAMSLLAFTTFWKIASTFFGICLLCACCHLYTNYLAPDSGTGFFGTEGGGGRGQSSAIDGAKRGEQQLEALKRRRLTALRRERKQQQAAKEQQVKVIAEEDTSGGICCKHYQHEALLEESDSVGSEDRSAIEKTQTQSFPSDSDSKKKVKAKGKTSTSGPKTRTS